MWLTWWTQRIVGDKEGGMESCCFRFLSLFVSLELRCGFAGSPWSWVLYVSNNEMSGLSKLWDEEIRVGFLTSGKTGLYSCWTD